MAIAAVWVASADAALICRLSVRPTAPTVGRASQIELRQFVPYAGGTAEPTAVAYPWRVEAVSPRGRIFRVRVPQSSDRFVYRGTFVFPSPGRWLVRVTNFGPAYQPYPGHRPRVWLTVRR